MNENKSHYVQIKDFDRFMFERKKKQKQKILLKTLFIVF